jgi:tRNA pseudouridine55 synthase
MIQYFYNLIKKMIEQKSGFILINKQPGPTSFGVIAALRKITDIRKIGHTGTLDPFAEGLLLVAIGRESTKKITGMMKHDKEYIADLKLGFQTETMDTESEEEKVNPEMIKNLTDEKIKKVLENFVGDQEQTPPMYSAKKINGQKLCDLARKGIEVERKPNEIKIHELEMIKFEPEKNSLRIRVSCSSGTYIRVLAQDIGKVLGAGAYLTRLVRTKIDKYKIEDSITLDELTNDNWGKHIFNI